MRLTFPPLPAALAALLTITAPEALIAQGSPVQAESEKRTDAVS